MELMLSISGARGIVGESLTPIEILRIVSAFSQRLPKGKILIGRDPRPSGKAIEKLLEGYLRLLGRNVVLLGILPTPTIGLCVKHSGAAGGIAITASHNPEQWNALKLFNSEGMFLPVEFWNSVESGKFETPEYAIHSKVGETSSKTDCIQLHLERIFELPYVDVTAIKDSKFLVAYDGCGGAGPATILPMLSKLEVKTVAIGTAMDGNFIHEPEPTPRNLEMLSELVRTTGACLGLATDPDADRLALVDETGAPISEEYTLALAALHIFSEKRSDCVVNFSTSMMIDDIAKEHGVKVHRTRVGEYHVSKLMLEKNAIIGGEGNGGVIIPEMHPVRDATTAAAIILTLMAKTGKKVSELVSMLPKRFMFKKRMPFSGNFYNLERSILKYFSDRKVRYDDGVWVGYDSGFIHIRPSNTEPIIRFIVEDSDELNAKELIKTAFRSISG